MLIPFFEINGSFKQIFGGEIIFWLIGMDIMDMKCELCIRFYIHKQKIGRKGSHFLSYQNSQTLFQFFFKFDPLSSFDVISTD